jgi:hypothetical protein
MEYEVADIPPLIKHLNWLRSFYEYIHVKTTKDGFYVAVSMNSTIIIQSFFSATPANFEKECEFNYYLSHDINLSADTQIIGFGPNILYIYSKSRVPSGTIIGSPALQISCKNWNIEYKKDKDLEEVAGITITFDHLPNVVKIGSNYYPRDALLDIICYFQETNLKMFHVPPKDALQLYFRGQSQVTYVIMTNVELANQCNE